MTIREHFRTNFNIRVQQSTASPDVCKLLEGSILNEFCCNTSLLAFNPITIKADPFLFYHNDSLYLFYEQKRRKEKGVIMMVFSQDLVHWSEPCLILSEPFHLSFPYVFKCGDAVYLLPECGESNSVRLYKFKDDSLSQVEFVTTLLTGAQYVDSSIIQENGQFYMFTSDEEFRQRLFVSNSLMGNYLEHPMSPIYQGKDFGRNGGSVIRYHHDLYRVSQDCSYLYGGNVNIHLIKNLTDSEYEEECYMTNLFDKKDSFYRYGGHQFNIVQTPNYTFLATDALQLSFNLFQIIDKLKKKLHF